jgi:hypothetical protein
MLDYVRNGYWLVVPYSAIRGHPLLKIAPVGVVPQRERRPRPIMDYTYNGVNQASLPLAPRQAMQFGHSLQRILQQLAYANPSYGPPLLAKLDLADGYYRIPLSASAALELAVVLPSDQTGEPLIGLPLSLPMGWSNSPPYFCAFTETCADLANTRPAPPIPHHLHFVTAAQDTETHNTFDTTVLWPHNPDPPQQPLDLVDVYIDDFMLMAQPPVHHNTMDRVLRHLCTVFCDTTGSPRKSFVSASKVAKGDATFSTKKRILGWDIDTAAMHLTLPTHRQHRLRDLLYGFSTRHYASRKKWQQLLGELRSMALAIHSAKYLFCILQQGLLKAKHRRFRLTALIRAALLDWITLLHTLHDHPVPIAALVPHAPHYCAAVDASGNGMGGFWVPTTLTTDIQPYAWRHPFSTHIKSRLVSYSNPTGDLNNSELELAALLVGHQTQQHFTPPIPFTATLMATDNMPAHAWVTKGSPTSDATPAFLLRQLAYECRASNAVVTTVFVPGTSNTIADFLSRSWNLSDDAVLRHLNRNYPTQPPWRLVTPPSMITCALNSALSKQLPQKESRADELRPRIPAGRYGQNSASRLPATPSSVASPTQCPSSKFSLPDTGWEHWLPPALQSNLARWKERYVPLARRWPHWGSMTPAYNLAAD